MNLQAIWTKIVSSVVNSSGHKTDYSECPALSYSHRRNQPIASSLTLPHRAIFVEFYKNDHSHNNSAAFAAELLL